MKRNAFRTTTTTNAAAILALIYNDGIFLQKSIHPFGQRGVGRTVAVANGVVFVDTYIPPTSNVEYYYSLYQVSLSPRVPS
eukprot:CCRYP_014215-RA/>CCRYP_014215-RA protein AED:0.00 eAED:0.00 QI:137/1/1/1/0/0/2/0/80